MRLFLLLFLAPLVSAQDVTITVLSTTDLHGNLLPYDYFQARPAPRGLAKVATLIGEVRRENPNTLLVDCGDTIQGTPLESVFQTARRDGKANGGKDPMMAAMNLLGYDAMAVGNHEYNFGLPNLLAARREAAFPWLSANTERVAGATVPAYAPYMVKTVGGVKVAVIGVTTPAVPAWEKKENYAGYRFVEIAPAIRAAVVKLRASEQPDLIVVAAHAGLDRDLRTGRVQTASMLPHENDVYTVASEVEGVDAIVFGHTHQQLASADVHGVLLAQAKNWGASLARLDFTMARQDGRWRVREKRSRLLAVTAETPADERLVRLAQPYQEATERYLNTTVATAAVALPARYGRVEDSGLVDAVQHVQLHYTGADVSFTALFNPRLTIAAGPVTVRQIAALYLYENELYAIEGTGRMVRLALENAARYFGSDGGINKEFYGFNYDMAAGVEYELDVTRPVGSRVVNLRWHGQPLRDEQKLKIALNNYRAGGSGGYDMFVGTPVVYRSGREIRELITEYYTERKRLPERADGNWRIVPESARERLRGVAID